MSDHSVYRTIVNAVKASRLNEPFTERDFRKACSGLPEGTYRAFLHKHELNNPSGNTKLFRRVSPGKFEVIRPFKYDIS